ncbi:hypothetical protein KPL78_07175 [Roseomonas sp. HJA6]|uniref:Uncharacterized protein n=1 Tax=Roseomonas alba TaxID=2846776 RepID=A0ABS7A5N8_9PROT|nr:hypothetical protein [Neoroseomonas alba]MBW6397619.1 hypothetical protein [Neoroseomonas alba]
MGVEAALAAVAVSAVASAGTAIYSGQQQKAAAEAEAAQYAVEADAARVAAEQEIAAKRRDLSRTLGAIDALRLGRGLELMSPSGEAIRRENIDAAETDITTIGANLNSRSRRIRLGASTALDRGEGAVVGSYGQAVGSLANGVSGAYSVMSRAGAMSRGGLA